MTETIAKYPFTLDHPSLKGHFPGNPVIPGVVILNKVLESISAEKSLKTYRIVSAKFQNPLIPPAVMTVQITEQSANRYNYKAMAEETVISNGIIEILKNE